MTRTLVAGPLGKKHGRYMKPYSKHSLAALEAVRPGIAAKEVDLGGKGSN